MKNEDKHKTIALSRRRFVGLGAAAALGAVGMAGCSPSTGKGNDGVAEAVSEEESAKEEVASWLGSAPEIPDADIANEQTCDLLIIGAGNAGMTAAAKAAELGLDFRLIDKNSQPSTPRSAIGAINDKAAIEAGCTEDPFKILRELVRYSSGKCDSDVVKVWINESADMINWVADIMDDYGFDIEVTADRGLEEAPAYYCPATEHRFTARKGGEHAEYTRHDVLLDYIRKKGYDLEGGISLAKLLTDETGAVVGAVVQNASTQEYAQINAKNVLLCTGGYADNPEMMWQLQPAASQTIAAWMLYPGNDGHGIKAALWAGAEKDIEPTPMLFDRGALAPGIDAGVVKDGESYSAPIGYITTKDEYNPGTQPFLKVNRRGERFANEAGPYTDIVWAAQNQPGHVWCQVFDASYTEDWERFHTLGCSALARLRADSFVEMIDSYANKGIICKADTLEELATLLGFEGEDGETFLATVERYNELYDAGEDADFGKPAYRLSEIRTAPFYGVWLGTTLLTTADGIKINESCQALDASRNPIPGLFVAGDCAGSFFANNYPYLFPGLCCGHCMVQGWKAIQVIADNTTAL